MIERLDHYPFTEKKANRGTENFKKDEMIEKFWNTKEVKESLDLENLKKNW